ncbi:nuclear envelope protein Cut8 [Lineolata rhizophorae]|uniref:Tethering factor for nuclear proteasome STS1 n=1 Tax=Lineolata rhizophorae TaxID=578093 RepID=A0A6A6PCB5_9PEZI|nr:nuclear envelope protein Cut8 [Lineolata rhizophorae]
MNSVIPSQPQFAPHLLQNLRLSPSRSLSAPTGMSNRLKRKADDDGSSGDGDDRMSASPSNSPAMAQRTIVPPAGRTTKRMRTNISGHPLSLPRLLETLSADDMRTVLRSICERHADVGAEVVTTAPRPSVASALEVLGKYEAAFRQAFPFGCRNSSDYTYNRVRQPLLDLLEALKDFTPHFLPPNESQTATSFNYLDGATELIHRLPDWESYLHNRHKQDAYEEIGKAWALVIKEAAKRGGGIQLQYGGWDQKLAKHNEVSGGRMQDAVNELRSSIGWMGGEGASASHGMSAGGDISSIRQQLLNGTYGRGYPMRA